MSGRIDYFGYGSLVNLDTLRTPYLGYCRATLHNFRRIWLPGRMTLPDDSSIRFALLSVESCAGSSIDGLVIGDSSESLVSLDERESSYDRRVIDGGLDFPDSDFFGGSVFLYVRDYDVSDDISDCYILRSYLDAVAQGFLRHYGELGLSRFVESTSNFVGLYDDRSSPLYPRSVILDSSERDLVDYYFGQ